jgi:hypothetical protein
MRGMLSISAPHNYITFKGLFIVIVLWRVSGGQLNQVNKSVPCSIAAPIRFEGIYIIWKIAGVRFYMFQNTKILQFFIALISQCHLLAIPVPI